MPGDDGTFAALITALRLTGGDHEAPLAEGKLAVERLGGPGAAVGVRREPGKGIALASSRAVLEPAGLASAASSWTLAGGHRSGLVFLVDPGRLASQGTASLGLRRAVELARGAGMPAGARLDRTAGRSPGLEIEHRARARSVRSEPRIEISPRSTRSGCVGPRGRGRGLREPRPGPGACLLGRRLRRGRSGRPGRPGAGQPRTAPDPGQPAGGGGRGPARGGPVAASPRLDPRLARRSQEPGPARPRPDRAARRRGGRGSSDRRRDPSSPCRPRGRAEEAGEDGHRTAGPGLEPCPILRPLARSGASAAGRSRPALRGRTVLIGWGEGTLAAALGAGGRVRGIVRELIRRELARARRRDHPPESGHSGRAGCRSPSRGSTGRRPLVEALAQGPPVVWTGWTHAGRATDRVSWPGLSATAQRFLDAIPLAEEVPLADESGRA